MDGVWRDDPWLVDPAAFAACAGPAARLRFLVTYAVLAPSARNTQPWLFRLRGPDLLELHADRSRALPVADPEDRALTIACGAALANLRGAAAALGESLAVSCLPDPAEGALLARLRAGGACAPAPGMARLLRAMTARRTSRFAFGADAVPSALRAETTAAAEAAGDARLHWIEPFAQRHALALLVAEADALQIADPAFRHELATWMRFRHGAGASQAGRRLEIGPGEGPSEGPGEATDATALAEGAPALALLTTAADTPRAWLAAGEALQRALLALTAGGFAASFLNQPVQVPSLRSRLAETIGAAIGAASPQILLRIGRGPRPVAATRRPVRDVLREG